jgi:predicted dienelactone hydrolase
MPWYRTSLAAAVVVASLSGLTSCDGGASYPVQDAYTKPGPYATTTGTVTGATGTAIYDEYHPASYTALGFKSPIVTWGNGTGGKPADVAVFLRHLASYGFTVIATTLPNTGSGREIDAAARYLVAQDSVPGSVFYHRLDITEVAAVGSSQGAGGAVRAATNDPTL